MILVKGCSNSFQDTDAPLGKNIEALRLSAFLPAWRWSLPRKQKFSMVCSSSSWDSLHCRSQDSFVPTPKSFHQVSFLPSPGAHASLVVGEVSLTLAVPRDTECPLGKNSARKIIDADVRRGALGGKNLESAVSVISPWNFDLPLPGNELRQMSLFILLSDYQNGSVAERRGIRGANHN